MTIEYVDLFDRKIIRQRKNDIFVFGDNLLRKGFGGQAKECRGEPNAIGIPTKHAPTMLPSAFFTDDDFLVAKEEIDKAFLMLVSHIRSGGTVVFPSNGIGTGLAQLPQRAPRIYNYIVRCTQRLSDINQSLDFSNKIF